MTVAADLPVEIETDVLVIGSGPAGAGSALALATLGVDHVVITKYRWTANTPRAHITNQRTVEIFRDLGIETEVLAQATPHELMGDTVFCTSLTGDEIGRVRTWLTHPSREADYRAASPSPNCDLPQTLLEPILIGRAAERGSRIRFDTEYLALTPVLGAPARSHDRRDRARAGPDGPHLGRVARGLGLRHQPAAARGGRGVRDQRGA
jgi:2,4-dichlorophenol 6-monooxygenase